MKIKTFLALAAVGTGLVLSTTVMAKEIKIGSNDTSYSDADVQKLAATAVGMGVKEPVNLNKSGDSVEVSGASATRCTFKVGSGAAPQIQGVNCK